MLRAVDNNYVCQNFDAIKAKRPLTADDSVLAWWATVPMELKAHELMAAWGFSYTSQCAWVKTNADGSLHLGTGYWFINAHEILLIGTRGKVPAPALGTQFPSVIFAPLGKRPNEKPAIFRQMLERMFPTLPKLEMCARGKAPDGWDFWGAEAEESDAA